MFEGFERHEIDTEDARIVSFIGGSGPPLLLLHGYPQTHVAWHRLAPVLSQHYTVVATDLRGYGDSRGPQQVDAAAYSKRTMARDQLAVMKHFGFHRFGLIGHDRGARVGYRLVLDHPDTVHAFVSLTVIPSAEMWARAGKAFGLGAYHWLLFAQPYDLPERLLSSDPDHFLDWTLRKMEGSRLFVGRGAGRVSRGLSPARSPACDDAGLPGRSDGRPRARSRRPCRRAGPRLPGIGAVGTGAF